MGTAKWEEVSRPQNKADRPSEYHRESTAADFLATLQSFSEAWKDKKKVLISEPSLGYVDYRTHESCWDLAFSLARYETESNYKFFKTMLGRMLVAYSREKFAELAVDYHFDYLLYIDDDHIWPIDLFQQLQKHLDKYDIVAPLCVQRQEPYYPVIYKSKFTKQDDGKTYYESDFMLDWKKGDLVEPDTIGFGCAIVKVDLLRKMKKPWFFSNSTIGEDLFFCLKAKEVGAKIVVDTNVEAPHLEEGKPVSYLNYERCKKD